MIDGNSEVVTPNVTAVTRPFTERLLRDITSLTAEQQVWLVKGLDGLGQDAKAEIAKTVRQSRWQVSQYVVLKSICPAA